MRIAVNHNSNLSLADVCYAQMKESEDKHYTLILLDDSDFCFELDTPTITIVKQIEKKPKIKLSDLKVNVFQELSLDEADTEKNSGFDEIIEFLIASHIIKMTND